MNSADKSPTIIVHEDAADSLEELSEYIYSSSSARLRILKFIEKKPKERPRNLKRD